MKNNEVWSVLEAAYQDIESLLPKPVSFDRNLPLLAENGVMDSIAMVAFATSIEEIIAEQSGKEIRIVSEQAFSRNKSPFLSMQALAEFIAELLTDADLPEGRAK